MRQRILMALAIAAVPVGLSISAAGGAYATPHGHGPGGGAATGTAKCSVQGSLSFSPSLQASATGNSTVTLHANLVRCAKAAGSHGRTTGHIAVSLGTIPANTCTVPSSAPAFSGLSVRWTPTSKVTPSLASSAAGTVTTQTDGTAQVSYPTVTVTQSFPTTTGSITLNTSDTVANLTAACQGAGLSGISFGGSATL